MGRFVRILLFVCVAVAAIVPVALAGKGDGIIEAGEDETGELARAVQNPARAEIPQTTTVCMATCAAWGVHAARRGRIGRGPSRQLQW